VTGDAAARPPCADRTLQHGPPALTARRWSCRAAAGRACRAGAWSPWAAPCRSRRPCRCACAPAVPARPQQVARCGMARRGRRTYIPWYDHQPAAGLVVACAPPCAPATATVAGPSVKE